MASSYSWLIRYASNGRCRPESVLFDTVAEFIAEYNKEIERYSGHFDQIPRLAVIRMTNLPRSVRTVPDDVGCDPPSTSGVVKAIKHLKKVAGEDVISSEVRKTSSFLLIVRRHKLFVMYDNEKRFPTIGVNRFCYPFSRKVPRCFAGTKEASVWLTSLERFYMLFSNRFALTWDRRKWISTWQRLYPLANHTAKWWNIISISVDQLWLVSFVSALLWTWFL